MGTTRETATAARRTALALTLAAMTAVTAPLPALAETGGDTALYVERVAGTPAEAHEEGQQRTTVTSQKGSGGASPQTGDTSASPVAIAAAGALAGVAGALARRRRAGHRHDEANLRERRERHG